MKRRKRKKVTAMGLAVVMDAGFRNGGCRGKYAGE